MLISENIQQGIARLNCRRNCLSKIFQPIKVNPQHVIEKKTDIVSNSQRLMIELGLIRPASSGSFYFLPLGMRALEKLVNIVDDEMHKIGAQKLLLPTLCNSNLWKSTKRLYDFGSELFTVKDRHDNTYILSPTHEETVSDLLFSIGALSYKDFPLLLYQITSKYRDEIKPRFGLMRSKEFIMKDLYTFDVSLKAAEDTYNSIGECYSNILAKIGINYVKVKGSSGVMGGFLTHEYHYIAKVGEDRLLLCSNCGYAINTQLSGIDCCPSCKNCTNIEIKPGIEVGHTFLLGDRYSKPLKVHYITEKGTTKTLQMGSYGLGLSRLIAAAIETLSNEYEIRWPKLLAPYRVLLIPPKKGSKEDEPTKMVVENLYNLLDSIDQLQDNVLLDDRCNLTIGRRLVDARRFGYPFVVIIGPKALEESPLFELKDLEKNEILFLNLHQLLDYFKNSYKICT